MRFNASKADQKGLGAVITKTLIPQSRSTGIFTPKGERQVSEWFDRAWGELEVVKQLIMSIHPELDKTAPLTTFAVGKRWRVWTRS